MTSIKGSFQDKAGDATQAANDAAAQARDAGAGLIDQAKDGLGKVGDSVGDLYERARSKAEDLSDRIPYDASDAMAAGERAFRDGGNAVGKRVRNQPVEALILAGAIGYLVGWAVSRA